MLFSNMKKKRLLIELSAVTKIPWILRHPIKCKQLGAELELRWQIPSSVIKIFNLSTPGMWNRIHILKVDAFKLI